MAAADRIDRDDLTARVLPQMSLWSRTSPAPGIEKPAAGANPAVERFRVSGNAIVTGGAGDLAFTNVRALLQHGLEGLAIFDVNKDEAEVRIGKLEEEFPSVPITFQKVDITNPEEVDKAVEEVVKTLGSVDILITFAGIVSCHHSLDVSVAEFRRTIDVNTTGGFICAQAVARRMVAAKTGGRIILIASISGHTVNFPQPQAAYNTSKAAVRMLKSSLAAEWAVHGIRVNSISPGYMDTILNAGDGLEEARGIWNDRNPLGRMGFPEELTGVVVLLASKAGNYINGSDFVVDGGQTLF
ncbi:putative short chain dehydrogenase reductase family protein [Phaeoacremonium minimum UCRPA7]|uniref:D-arabinitol 2-dehydrogenase [ribulose-forming] n=1 Tax=Phaeoacremonium minimum (strain UCR-PA7) TaxID=1286976 RepID=R8BK63_PHAM7|nr:putative short chain dehydrogenase reductase family protein [Phaeoacremonium minimum UCRPA7]EON99743.1 putative short chain dehydrogenase reductase family protein [Phaeoacremonium minimum UCRPA7]